MNRMDHDAYQELIERADREVAGKKEAVSVDPHRLHYHIAAAAGWINDPNGLVQYKGEYHVFFQHHPYSADWGPMHWGHVKSRDLVHWEHLPVALAPGEEYDEGCFSGSAVDDQGTLTLIYTGHAENRNPKEVQCIAFSNDGIRFEKYEGNPVIPGPPQDGSADFRDPKVWKHGDSWYMVVGSGKDGIGKALLFSSRDLRSWEYVGVAAQSNGSQGHMWECPDLFPLSGRHVLIASPMGMEGSKNIYIVGDMDYETGKFTQGYSAELDYGFDFYAAQTFQDDQGRRILIGWMDMWGSSFPTKEKGWAGALTLPRVLDLLPDGTLSMKPVPELQSLRTDHKHYEGMDVTPDTPDLLGGLQGDALELCAEFDLAATTAEEFGLKLRCSKEHGEETRVLYQRAASRLQVDRSQSGAGDGGVCGARLEPGKENRVKLHIYLDSSSVEVFAGDGRLALSNRIFPQPDSLGVELFAAGGTARLLSLDVYKLKSIW